MFEVIMLFAFLYAATCQFLPKRPATTRTPLHKNSRPHKERGRMLRMSAQKDQTPVKVKSRSHNYAHAA